MKKQKLFTLSTLVVLITVFAGSQTMVQAQNEDEVDYETVQIMSTTGTSIYTENSKDIIGTPLLKESFEDGRILFESGKASEVVPINYDSYKNQVAFIKNKEIRILNINGVKGFVFEKPNDFENSDKVQEVFTFQIRTTELGFDEPTPVQVLYNQGTGLKLLVVHKTNLMQSNRKDPFTGKKTERYINTEEYYIQKHNGDFEEIKKLRAKHIMREFSRSDRKAMEDYMDENDLDSRSQKDLVKLMTFIDNRINSQS